MFDRRFTAVPQLETISSADDTNRAELIALPMVRTGMGDHVIDDVAAATAVAQADLSGAGVHTAV